MHTYTDPRKQALVNRLQAAIDKNQAYIESIRASLQPMTPNTYQVSKVRISDMSPEEQAKIVRMKDKTR